MSTEKRAQIIGCLTEGMSIRSTVRITGAAKNTITRLLVDLGEACSAYQHATLVDLRCTTIECDEIWNFVGAKDKNIPAARRGEPGIGSVSTWTAICADTKLIPAWFVGQRTADDGYLFMMDLRTRAQVPAADHDRWALSLRGGDRLHLRHTGRLGQPAEDLQERPDR